MKQGMQESYEKGVATARPRVLRCTPRGVQRSVNRGTGGLGIELRKQAIRTSTLYNRRKTTRAGAISRVPVRSCVVEDPRHAWKFHAREPGDLGDASVESDTRTAGEGLGRTARMHISEESDSGTVPMNQSNKDEKLLAEIEEGRPLIEENTLQPNTRSTQSEASVSQGLAGVRKTARENKEMRFTSLLHHVSVDLLRASFHSLKRKAAPGVDGVTWQEYESGLEGRITDLHSLVHRGAYRAQPSRRVYIEKEDGRKRPLGVAALEDKIVQQAVVTVLNQIYEEDFLGFSYGFRPGRSPHQAQAALSYALMKKKVNYVLDADIQGFFDNLDKSWLIKFVEHRVADSRILRLIRKWLNAGVMEEGQWSETKTGTPQGSVASPILANIYLHYVFDLWVNVWREKYARGEVVVIRYADDRAPRAQKAERLSSA